MATQIRLYTINRGCLLQFVKEWAEKVLPLRTEQGFTIHSASMNHETNQFIWIISCEDEGWEEKEKAYYESANRTEMDPDPARLIARAEEYFVETVV